ncbi:aspartic peptidase domain-containing protein [Trichoderma camerunense]
MKHFKNQIGWALTTGALAPMSVLAHHPTKPSGKFAAPVTLPLTWAESTLYRPGLWMLDVAVGTPPQIQTLTFDTDFADIEIHSASDGNFTEACKTQIPSFCSTYNVSASTSFKSLGKGTYHFDSELFGIPEDGDYSTEVLHLGGVRIKNQTFGYTTSSREPYGNFGLSPPNNEIGVITNTFPQYPTYLESLVQQGIYENACFSVWLDPEYPYEGFEAIPDGEVTFGGIDTGKFKGELVTFPVSGKVNGSSMAAFWDLSLTSITHGDSKTNLAAEPADCVISMGDGQLYLPDDVYHNLATSIPGAFLNESIGFYEVPCDAKNDPNNTWTVGFTSPKSPAHPKGQHISIDIPVQGVIWPMSAIFGPTADPNTCTIAAQGPYLGSACILGWTMTKFGYWVFDLYNGEISFAPPAAKGEKPSHIIPLPDRGVTSLNFRY